MTITKPRQRIPHVKFLFFLGALVLFGGGAYVFEYNTLVAERDAARTLKEGLVTEKLNEADLKHVVFETTAPKNLQEVAERHALFIEQKPGYLTIEKSEHNVVGLAN